MTGMMEFLHMGGFAAYVWPAWGIAAGLLIAIWGISARNLRRQQALAAALEAGQS